MLVPELQVQRSVEYLERPKARLEQYQALVMAAPAQLQARLLPTAARLAVPLRLQAVRRTVLLLACPPTARHQASVAEGHSEPRGSAEPAMSRAVAERQRVGQPSGAALVLPVVDAAASRSARLWRA